MTNLDNIAKSRDVTLPTKVHIVKVVVFPVVMYEYERWTIKKAEHPLSEKYKSNYNELSPHSCQNGHHQKVYKQKMLARMWRKENPPTLLVGM